MPRPRTISDASILEAVGRAVARLGPVDVGLRDVAEEAGLAASTIVQRFGSKKLLLLSFALEHLRTRADVFEQASGKDALGALEQAFVSATHPNGTPETVAHMVALDQLHLTDPSFRDEAATQWKNTRREVRRLLKKAVKKKQLRSKTDTRVLAQQLMVTVQGCLASWPVTGKSSLEKWVRKEIGEQLAPHRRG